MRLVEAPKKMRFHPEPAEKPPFKPVLVKDWASDYTGRVTWFRLKCVFFFLAGRYSGNVWDRFEGPFSGM